MTDFRYHKTIYSGANSAERILENYRSYRIEGVTFKKELLSWFDENTVTYGWSYREEQYDVIVTIDDPDIAILFKLTWYNNEEH